MVISGIVATASLVGVLVLLFIGGLTLTLIDKKVDANREH